MALSMETIQQIITNNSHRPWSLPTKRWAYYQEWNRVLFLHWRVPVELLRPLVPAALTIDTYDGQAWISLVPFTMEKIRPNGMPSFAPISNFHEINIRTYVTAGGKPGVYFHNIEAGKRLSAYLSRKLSGMPYEKATISRQQAEQAHLYTSVNPPKAFMLHAEFETGGDITSKSPLDLWLTERYCAYVPIGATLYRYNTHHLPWPLQQVQVNHLQTDYTLGGISLSRPPDAVHYSPGVQVIAWQREAIAYK